MYLKRKIGNLERKAQINRMEINRSAAAATKAQKELDLVNYQGEKLSSVIT